MQSEIVKEYITNVTLSKRDQKAAVAAATETK
jgi:hypothetical protein